jgi:hypothetical protein
VPGNTLNDPPEWPQGMLFAHVKGINEKPKFHTMSCGFDSYITDPSEFFCIRIFCPKYRNTNTDLITDLQNEFIPFHKYSFYFTGDIFSSWLQKPNAQIIPHFVKATFARFEHGE